MKPGQKIYIECVIDEKRETHLEEYYVAHIDQYDFSGHQKIGVKIYINKYNKIKE